MSGNRVTSERNGKRRVRSKNYIKVVPHRPTRLSTRHNVPTTSVDSDDDDLNFDISHIIGREDDTQREEEVDAQREEAHVQQEEEVHAQHEETQAIDEAQAVQPEEHNAIFQVDNTEAERLEAMFQAALARARDKDSDVGMTLRSSHQNLQWSTTMDPDAVLETDVETDV